MTNKTDSNPACHTDRQKQHLREEYLARVNRVIDYIEKNIEKDLSLETLAGVAHFSPFHFHRIFRAIAGETLHQFTQRLRLEKSATRLATQIKTPVTEIALDLGFSGSAAFSRSFREAFCMSPTEWRNTHGKNCKTNHNFHQPFGNFRKEFDKSSCYIDSVTHQFIWRIKMKNQTEARIEVKQMPEFHVAYVRHIGPYKGDAALFEGLFGRLAQWAGPRDLFSADTKMMAIYHDDPNVTGEDRLRTSACITIPQDTPVEGEVGKMSIPGGKFAVASFEVTSDGFEEAWNTVMGEWLPESGYQPDDRLCYEIYHNDYRNHPENKHQVDICVPVKPM